MTRASRFEVVEIHSAVEVADNSVGGTLGCLFATEEGADNSAEEERDSSAGEELDTAEPGEARSSGFPAAAGRIRSGLREGMWEEEDSSVAGLQVRLNWEVADNTGPT